VSAKDVRSRYGYVRARNAVEYTLALPVERPSDDRLFSHLLSGSFALHFAVVGVLLVQPSAVTEVAWMFADRIFGGVDPPVVEIPFVAVTVPATDRSEDGCRGAGFVLGEHRCLPVCSRGTRAGSSRGNRTVPGSSRLRASRAGDPVRLQVRLPLRRQLVGHTPLGPCHA